MGQTPSRMNPRPLRPKSMEAAATKPKRQADGAGPAAVLVQPSSPARDRDGMYAGWSVAPSRKNSLVMAAQDSPLPPPQLNRRLSDIDFDALELRAVQTQATLKIAADKKFAMGAIDAYLDMRLSDVLSSRRRHEPYDAIALRHVLTWPDLRLFTQDLDTVLRILEQRKWPLRPQAREAMLALCAEAARQTVSTMVFGALGPDPAIQQGVGLELLQLWRAGVADRAYARKLGPKEHDFARLYALHDLVFNLPSMADTVHTDVKKRIGQLGEAAADRGDLTTVQELRQILVLVQEFLRTSGEARSGLRTLDTHR